MVEYYGIMVYNSNEQVSYVVDDLEEMKVNYKLIVKPGFFAFMFESELSKENIEELDKQGIGGFGFYSVKEGWIDNV